MPAQITELAQTIMSPARTVPVVVVTIGFGHPAPFVDVDALARELAPQLIRVIATGDLTRALSELLPLEFGVFGGASRIWWPGLSETDARGRHPLLFAYSVAEGRQASERIVSSLEEREMTNYLTAAPGPVQQTPDAVALVGAHVSGQVGLSGPGGAEVQVAPGVIGWLVRRRRDPQLISGQQVEVRVVGFEADGTVLIERCPTSALDVPQMRTADHVRLSASAVGPEVTPVRPDLVTQVPALSPGSPITAASPGSWGQVGTPLVSAQQLDAAISGADELRALRATNDQLTNQLASLQRQQRSAGHLAPLLASAEAVQSKELRAALLKVAQLRSQCRSWKDRAEHFEAQVYGTGRHEDAQEQFRHEVFVEWQRSVRGDDRDLWPLPEYVVGDAFLGTMALAEGISRSKVVEVVAEVLTGRAAVNASREHHPLRVSEGGEAAQRVRADGAKAFRVSLQVNTPSARRLHYWRTLQGRCELASVGVHDDLTIM